MTIVSKKSENLKSYTIHLDEKEMQMLMVALGLYSAKVDNMAPDREYCDRVRAASQEVTTAWAKNQ